MQRNNEPRNSRPGNYLNPYLEYNIIALSGFSIKQSLADRGSFIKLIPKQSMNFVLDDIVVFSAKNNEEIRDFAMKYADMLNLPAQGYSELLSYIDFLLRKSEC